MPRAGRSAPRVAAQGAPGAPARWGGLDQPGYLARLGLLGAFFYFVLAKPIANDSYDTGRNPWVIVCALTGSFVAVAVFALLITTTGLRGTDS